LSDPLHDEDLLDLYENAPCGYLSISPDARVVRANATVCGWLDCEPRALLGRTIHEILGTGGKIAYETHIAPLLRLQGAVHEVALDIRAPGGGLIPVIAGAAENRGPAGEHRFTRLTLFRAEDRRKYERSLVEARAKAEAATEQKAQEATLRDQFIAVLGHDIRNPLAALKAGLRLLAVTPSDSDRFHRVLGEMNGSVERALRLVADVMDFARGRLGSGLDLAIRESEDLNAVLEHVVSEIKAIYPRRRIGSHIAIDEPVMCDPDRLGQLASNLLSNAVFHGSTDAGIDLRATIEDCDLRISVTNAGEPISDAVRAHLFEPFFRGKVRESGNGLGLGLFIVNQIARAHGGAMSVSSDDRATTFQFVMPIRPHG
jgi:phosphoserine phosphatase RsbU/P